MKIAIDCSHPHPLLPQPFLRLHQSSWWGAEAPPYPREREDEEEDDAEGWGPKPQLFVRWQKLSSTTIAISHSPGLSDYTDHYTAAVVRVGVCLRGSGAGGVSIVGKAGHSHNLLCSSTNSVKAADHYHSVYSTVTDNSWSSRASQEFKPEGKIGTLELLSGCVCVCTVSHVQRKWWHYT